MKVRKKAVTVDALQWTGENYEEICEFALMKLDKNEDGEIEIPTLEGTMFCGKGDFLIKGLQGELYPIREDLFYMTYDILE